MTSRFPVLPLAYLVLALVLFAGCEKKEADPLEEPTPPTYAPADIADLVAHEGGTGGGPNMGEVTIVLFDGLDDSRIQGAEVILEHGGTSDQATTDSNGQVDFTGVTPGAVMFTAVKQGYVILTMVDVNAATVVVSMDRRAVLVSGTITNTQSSGTHLEMELLTKEFDDFNQVTQEKYGYVADVTPPGATANWTYEVRLLSGVSDQLVVREVNSTTRRVINRTVKALGPCTDDTAVPITLPATPEAGLHEVVITVTNVVNGALKMEAWYEENLVRYTSYSATQVSPGNWTINLQMPTSVTGATVNLDTYTSSDPSDPPSERDRMTYDSGNATALGSTSHTLDMVELTGEFVAPTSTLFLVEARYYDGFYRTIGIVNAGNDYTLRVPRNMTLEMRVFGLTGTGAGTLGQITEHDRKTVGPFTADDTENWSLTATTLFDIDTNLPAGIPDPAPFAVMTGPYPSEDNYLGFPWISDGTVTGSNVDLPLRYEAMSGFTYLMILSVADANNEDLGSKYIRGGLVDPATDLGSPYTINLLEMSAGLSPAQSEVVSRDSLRFAWSADAALVADGWHQLEVVEVDGDTVWNIFSRGATQQVALKRLPTALAALDLQAGRQYSYTVQSIRLPGMDFDDFYFDTFPRNLADTLTSTNVFYITEGEKRTFQIQ